MILEKDVEFPEDENSTGASNIKSEQCKSFISWCLSKDPANRGGVEENANDLLNHEWFDDLDIPGLLNYSVNAPLIPEMPEEEDDEEMEEKQKDIDSPRLSVLEEGILDEIQKFDPMFKGFYLDQLNTPAPQTPVGVTPPPELIKNSISNNNEKNNSLAPGSSQNINDDKLSQRSLSKHGSVYSNNNDYQSVSMKKTYTQDQDGNSTNKDIEILSKSNRLGASIRNKDLNIDTYGGGSQMKNFGNYGDEISVSEGVGSRLMSPRPISPSFGSTNEKNRGSFNFNFDLYSPAILLQKEETLRNTNIGGEKETDSTSNINSANNNLTSNLTSNLANNNDK